MTLLDLLRIGERVDTEVIEKVCEVDPSTARDYLRFLKATMSADLTTERVGRRKGYRLRKRDEPTVEDITRAASLRFGEAALDVFRGTKYHREVQIASRRERALVVRDAVDELDRLTRGLYRRCRGPSTYEHKAEALEVWLDGIRERRSIQMHYERADGHADDYVVDPLMLVLYQDRLHLLTRRHPDHKPRTFNLDGVLSAKLLPQAFTPPDPADCDPANVYRHSFGIFSDLPEEHVEVLLRGPARVLAEQRPFHPSQVRGPEEGDWRHFTYRLAVCPEFRDFLLGLVPNVRVAAPGGLRQKLADRLAEGLEVLRGDIPDGA